MTDFTKGPHISVFTVRPVTEADNKKLPHGYRANDRDYDTGYILTHLDGFPVKCRELVSITVRTDRGVPRLVYIDGGHPLYETWVKDEKGVVIAHFPGHLAEKDMEYVHG